MTEAKATTKQKIASSLLSTADLPDNLNRLKPLLFALPVHYKVKLEPLIEEKIVRGSETISFEVVEQPHIENDRLVCYLNSIAETKIKHASIDGEQVTFEEPKTKDGNDYSKSVVKYLLPLSKLSLFDTVGKKFDMQVEFLSQIRDDLEGQYLAKSCTKDHGDQTLMVTQFESHFARRAFPCVDEPECKATFEFSFLVNDDLDVLHNTKLVSKEPYGDSSKILHTFEPTLKLSTYLIAYCIGKFDKVSKRIPNKDGSDITVEICGPAHTKKFFENTLDHACNVNKELMEFFGQYPIDKVAHVALPDFSAGAMENMGLITYRDSLLQLTSENSLARQMICILVICHELAHTWFGNLVTMKWWNDLWLNESFATCIEYVIAQKCYEKLGLAQKYPFMQRFIGDDKYGGMDLDSRQNSHPISVEVKTPSDIESIFDSISYNKGSAILYMCIGYMGEKKFFQAVRTYLEKYRLNNAEANDLWNTMSECSGLPVTKIMNYWIDNQGFPCIDLELTSDGKLKMSQHRFRDVHRHQIDDNTSVDDKIWPIPMTIEYTSNTGKQVPHKILFDQQDTFIDLTESTANLSQCSIKSLCPNKDAHGFFIYNLSNDLHEVVQQSFSQMNDLEKIEYIRNIGFLMSSSIVDSNGEAKQRYPQYTIDNVLLILKKLNIGTKDYSARVAMHTILRQMIGIARKCDLATPGYYKKFLEIVEKIFEIYPLPDIDQCTKYDDYNRVQAELDTISFHVNFNTQSVLQKMRDLYANRHTAPINDAHLANVYRVISADMNDEWSKAGLSQDEIDAKFNEFMDKLLEEADSRTRGPSISGVGRGMSSKNMLAYFRYAYSQKSRLQDLVYFTRSICWPAQANKLLEYIRQDSAYIMEKIPFSSRMRSFKDVDMCCTEDQLKLVASINSHCPGYCQERIVQEVCDYIRANLNDITIFSKQLEL